MNRPRLPARLGWLAAAAIAGAAAWMMLRPLLPQTAVSTSIVAPEVPVVMRTQGGVMEVATVRVFERFSRSDTRDFWGIDLGTTVSQIQVTVTYRYHVPLAREWPMTLRGRTCIVRAPHPLPSLPVAFDTGTLQKYSRNGWARFNQADNLAALEKTLTAQLAQRSASDGYLQLAREAGRETIAEFVTTWLVRERGWRREPGFRVIVVYPGEEPPPRNAAPDAGS